MAKYKYKLTDGNGDDLLPIPANAVEAAAWRTALNLNMESYAIPNNTDLNSLVTTGLYHSPPTVAGVGTLINCPVGAPFIFIVCGGGSISGCVQAVIADNACYTRRGTTSGFGDWWKIEGTRMT